MFSRTTSTDPSNTSSVETPNYSPETITFDGVLYSSVPVNTSS